MQSKRVVLPAPLWPMRPRISPSRSSRLTPSTARMPPKCFATSRHSRITSAPSAPRPAPALPVASTSARLPPDRPSPASRPCAHRPRSTTRHRPVGTDTSAPAMNTDRRMSGRSSSSAVGPEKRTSPFSRNTARSASSRATLTDCSTTTMVVPCAWSIRTTLEELGHDGGGQSERELVDHQELGLDDERHGQRQHLLLAARQVARLLVGRAGRAPGTARGPVGARPRSGALSLRMSQAAQSQVLVHGQRREHAPPAGHEGDALVRHLVGHLVGDVRRQLDVALTHLDQAAHRLQQRRLPGTVGAEQGHDLARSHVEVDAEEHLDRAVGDLDLPAAATGGAGRRGRRCRRPGRRRSTTWSRSATTAARRTSAWAGSARAAARRASSWGAWSARATGRSATRFGTHQVPALGHDAQEPVPDAVEALADAPGQGGEDPQQARAGDDQRVLRAGSGSATR